MSAAHIKSRFNSRSAARSTRGVTLGQRSANDRIKHPVSNGNNHSRRTQDAQKSTGRSLRYCAG